MKGETTPITSAGRSLGLGASVARPRAFSERARGPLPKGRHGYAGVAGP